MKGSLTRVEELVEIVKDRLDTDEPGPNTNDPSEIAFYWVACYFESKGYTYYARAQSAKPVTTKLAERGWFLKWRVPSMVDPNRRPPRPKEDPLYRDPIAIAVRRISIDETLVKTPEELIKEASTKIGRGEPDVADLPATPKELHTHLVRIAPALQTRYRFVDEERLVYGLTTQEIMRFFSRPGYLRTEYWENVKTGEALWAFTAFRTRTRESDQGVVYYVWEKVKALEKLAEVISEPLNHESKEDEDREVRQVVGALYLEGTLALFNERVRNQP